MMMVRRESVCGISVVKGSNTDREEMMGKSEEWCMKAIIIELFSGLCLSLNAVSSGVGL